MIDLHNHVLPGIDDGALDEAQSLEMLQQLLDAGFSRIAMTSHLRHPMFPHVTAAVIRERAAWVAALVEEHQLPIEVLPGAEIYYHGDLLSELEDGELVPLGGEGSYYLIEFAPADPLVHMKELAFELTVKGIKPVLAHPERYHALQRKPALAEEWRRAGWILQLDIGSLMGSEGRGIRKLSQKLLKDRSFDLAATDLHRPLKPSGQLQKILARLPKEVGEEEAHRLLVLNPGRILEGRHVLEAEDL